MLELLLFLGARIMNAAAFFWICLYSSYDNRYRCTVCWQRHTWSFYTRDQISLAPISVKLLGLPETVRLWWPKALRDGRSCRESKDKPPLEKKIPLSLGGDFVIALRSLSLAWILDYLLIRNWFKDDYRLALVRIEYKSATSLTDTQASSDKVKQF